MFRNPQCRFCSLVYLCIMITDNAIYEPFLFNPLKHHLGFIREFINLNIDKNGSELQDLAKDLKHLGTSVMDIYTGSLSIRNILNEIEEFLKQKDILRRENYSVWAGSNMKCFRIISLTCLL